MKALYILILWSLQGKFDIVANKRQIFESRNPPSLLDFLGEVKYWCGLDNVHIGTIRTILRLIWGIGLALSPPRFIKLTHSRMSVGCSAALMRRLDTELALKIHSGILPLTYTGIGAQCWKAVSSKKLSPSTATEMHFLSCCGCFSRGILRW